MRSRQREINTLISTWEAVEANPGVGAAGKGLLLEDTFLLTKTYLLLARVRKAEGNAADSLESLNKAKANQAKALTRVLGEGGAMDQLGAQQEVMAEVCLTLGAAFESGHDPEQALAVYKEGLKHKDDHEACLVAICKLHLRAGELDAAQQHVSALMASNSADSTTARMLLADVMLSKVCDAPLTPSRTHHPPSASGRAASLDCHGDPRRS